MAKAILIVQNYDGSTTTLQLERVDVVMTIDSDDTEVLDVYGKPVVTYRGAAYTEVNVSARLSKGVISKPE